MSVIRSIDWSMLRTQKATLLEVADKVTDLDQVYNLDGILSLLDAIQDEAVERGWATEEQVFGTETA